MPGQLRSPRLPASLRILGATFLLLLLVGVAPAAVRATAFAVTVTMNDANSGGNSDVIHSGILGCAGTGAAPCSLRDAILFANNQATTDTTTITLPAGTYTLTIPGNAENAALSGDLDILRNVVINGAGANTTIVQASKTGNVADAIDRVFEVGFNAASPAVTINGVLVRNGGNTGSLGAAGGIVVQTAGSTLTLNDCFVLQNVVPNNSNGGGIYLQPGAALVANRTTVGNNTSGGSGGGIYNDGGTVTLTNTTLFGNSAVSGGGIYSINSGTVTLVNSTLSGNNATFFLGGGIYNLNSTLVVTNSTLFNNSTHGIEGGGGIYNQGTLTLTNGTIVSNHSDNVGGRGGGIFNNGGTITAVNTLIAGNTTAATGSGPDILGAFATGSKNNLLGDGSGAFGIADNDANHNIVGHSALLATTLQSNGTTNGTSTLALLTGSPAINAGDNATCANTTGAAPVAGKDQRGVARPQGAVCDIGAFEYVFALATVTLVSSANPSAVGQSVTFTATVTGSGGTPTGTVTFMDGATTLGSGTLAGGTTPIATGSLAVGSHAIAAVYSGDTTFAPSNLPDPHSGRQSRRWRRGGPTGGLQFFPLPTPVRLLDTRPGQTAFVHPGMPLSPRQPSPSPVASPPVVSPCRPVLKPSSAMPPSITPLARLPVSRRFILPGRPATGEQPQLRPRHRPSQRLHRHPRCVTAVLLLYSNTGGNFIIDITGYYAPPAAGGLFFHPLSQPVRLLDTRPGQTASVHPNAAFTPGQTLNLPGRFTFSGVTVPTSAKALAGNATVDNTGNAPAGFATLYPGGATLPLASNLNFAPGTVAPNAFTVALGADGSFNLYQQHRWQLHHRRDRLLRRSRCRRARLLPALPTRA